MLGTPDFYRKDQADKMWAVAQYLSFWGEALVLEQGEAIEEF